MIMIRRANYCSVFCCLLLLISAGCVGKNETATDTPPAASPVPSSSPTVKAPPEMVVRTSIPEVRLGASGAAEVEVRLEIADGYHINANPPTYAYLIPTSLEVISSEGITAGQPTYPAPLTKKFAFAAKPLAVYEGEAIIKLPLRSAGTAAKGSHTLSAKLRVQACDNEACYPPRTFETSISVTIN